MKYYFVPLGNDRYEVRLKATNEKFHVGEEIKRQFESGEVKK